ncbi:hypothetical protein [Micromonospora sp. NPDC093277]|uniref:hypothetical protein n=1 Tax=Micromonospora sp. NPDC093277 TaxID=3364291 RepID=UPI003805CD40
MASPPAGSGGLYYDDRNTARPTRARFRYQDECVALRCIPNLLSEGVTAVVIEWSTDYIALLPDDGPELVSVKHRDPGTGEWSMSELKPVIRDLHRVWQAMGESCRCAFASNAALSRDARKRIDSELGAYVDADPDEVERFKRVLSMPDPPLPRRSEITSVGIRDMGGALSLLDRDPHYAEQCYYALVDRIAAVGTEEPPSPEQRIARLTGSLRAVADRGQPQRDEQTLLIADLRELVVRHHDAAVRHAPPRLGLPPRPARTPGDASNEWQGGQEIGLGDCCYLIHDPVHVRQPEDRSYRECCAPARQLAPQERDVRIVRLDVLRAGRRSDDRRAQLIRAADLQRRLPGLARILDVRHDAGQVTVIAERSGPSLPDTYGPPPYPGIALDSLLRGLPAVARTLDALHDAGHAHRALHPGTLLVALNGLILRDVGLAVVPAAAGEGHPAYRAPEQDRPALLPPGPVTDVYQLAAVIYHLAVGQPPGSAPPLPTLMRPELSPSLDAPLLAGLAPTPADRPTPRDLVAALTGVLRCGGTVRC